MPSSYDLFRVRIQKEATPGTDPGSWADAHNIRCERPEVKPAGKTLEDNYMRAYDYEMPGQVGTENESEITLVMPLDGWKASPATGDYAPNEFWMTYIMELILYGYWGENGDTVSATVIDTTVTDSTVQLNDDQNYKSGQLIGIKDSNNDYYGTQLISQSGNIWTIAPKIQSANHADGDSIIPLLTFFPLEEISDKSVQHISIQYDGHDADSRRTFLGCHPKSATLRFENGEVPKLEVTFASMRVTPGTSDLSYAAYSTYKKAPPVAGSKILFADQGSEDHGSTYSAYSIEVDFGLTVNSVKDDNDTDGLSGWHMAGHRSPRVTFQCRFDDGLYDDYMAKTLKSFFYQYRDEMGTIWCIYLPSCVLAEMPQETEQDGFSGMSVTLMPVAHARHTALAGDTNDWTKPHNKSIYIAHG